MQLLHSDSEDRMEEQPTVTLNTFLTCLLLILLIAFSGAMIFANLPIEVTTNESTEQACSKGGFYGMRDAHGTCWVGGTR